MCGDGTVKALLPVVVGAGRGECALAHMPGLAGGESAATRTHWSITPVKNSNDDFNSNDDLYHC